MEKRTRLGKVVGSIKTNPEGFGYGVEKNWSTGEDGFVIFAPSGARLTWHRDEADAMLDAAARNREWFA